MLSWIEPQEGAATPVTPMVEGKKSINELKKGDLQKEKLLTLGKNIQDKRTERKKKQQDEGVRLNNVATPC